MLAYLNSYVMGLWPFPGTITRFTKNRLMRFAKGHGRTPEMLIEWVFPGCFMSFGSKMALIIFCAVIFGIIAEGFHDIFAASCTMFCVKYFA